MNFSVNIQVLTTKKSIKYDQKKTLLFIIYREIVGMKNLSRMGIETPT